MVVAEKCRSIQALRFAAAVAVMQSHIVSGGLGAFGVDVFFVISGLIITRTARGSAGDFFISRALRVAPPYYVVIGGILWAHAVTDGLDVYRTLASLLLWPAFGSFAWPYLTVAWSLCFEMLFYAAFALRRAGVKPVWLLSGYAGAWLLALLTAWPVFVFVGAPISMEFLFGIGIALYAPSSWRMGVAALFLAAGLFLALGTTDVTPLLVDPVMPTKWARPLVVGVPAALLVYGVLQLEPLFRGWWARALAFLGDASYAIYLTHLFVIALMMNGTVQAAPWIVMLASVGAGVCFYLVIERPVLGLIRELRKPKLVLAAAE
jgi:exopolysaccharide production protein ExoZ